MNDQKYKTTNSSSLSTKIIAKVYMLNLFPSPVQNSTFTLCLVRLPAHNLPHLALPFLLQQFEKHYEFLEPQRTV